MFFAGKTRMTLVTELSDVHEEEYLALPVPHQKELLRGDAWLVVEYITEEFPRSLDETDVRLSHQLEALVYNAFRQERRVIDEHMVQNGEESDGVAS